MQRFAVLSLCGFTRACSHSRPRCCSLLQFFTLTPVCSLAHCSFHLFQYKSDLAQYEASERLRKAKYEEEVRKYEADMALWQQQQAAEQQEQELRSQQQQQQFCQQDQEQRELQEALQLSMQDREAAAPAPTVSWLRSDESTVPAPAPARAETAAEREERELAEVLRLSALEAGGAAAATDEANPFGRGARLMSNMSNAGAAEASHLNLPSMREQGTWDDGGKEALAAALDKANRRMRK